MESSASNSGQIFPRHWPEANIVSLIELNVNEWRYCTRLEWTDKGGQLHKTNNETYVDLQFYQCTISSFREINHKKFKRNFSRVCQMRNCQQTEQYSSFCLVFSSFYASMSQRWNNQAWFCPKSPDSPAKSCGTLSSTYTNWNGCTVPSVSVAALQSLSFSIRGRRARSFTAWAFPDWQHYLDKV